MSEPELDMTTSKIRDLFKDSFVSVAATGILNGTIENVLRLLAAMLKSDVHDVERTNGIIKREVRRSPHIALPLLSARVQLKNATGGNSQQTKWSQLHAGIEKVAAECVDGYLQAEVVREPERFAPVTEDEVRARRTHVPKRVLSPAFVLATKAGRRLHDELKTGVLKCCVFGNDLRHAWLRIASHYFMGLLVKCDIVQPGPGGKIQLTNPVVILDSLRMLQDAILSMGGEIPPANVYEVAWEPDSEIFVSGRLGAAAQSLDWALDIDDFDVQAALADVDTEMVEYSGGLEIEDENIILDARTAQASEIVSSSSNPSDVPCIAVDAAGHEYADQVIAESMSLAESAPPLQDATPDIQGHEQFEATWKSWQDAVGESVAVLLDRLEALDKADDLLCKFGNMAFMEFRVGDGPLMLHMVHWTDVASRKGKSIRLDERNGVIYALPSLKTTYPVLDYSDAVMVHPNIGVRMQKERKPFRPIIPPRMQRLRTMWARLGEDENEGEVITCKLCSETTWCHTCPLCLMAWHPTCEKLFAEWVVSNELSSGLEASLRGVNLSIGSLYMRGLCTLCAHVYHCDN